MKNKLNEKGITLTSQTGIFLAKQGVSPWREENKGITLIALVITVIVLLILAGAAVSIGLNGDDLFAKANEAKAGWNEKVADEDQKLNDAWNILNSIDSASNNRVTLEMILDFIEEDDVCWSWNDQETTKKLICLGHYSSENGWNDATVFRCSIDGNIYIVGTRQGQEEKEMEREDWDGTVTVNNEGKPLTLSTPYGDYDEEGSSMSVQTGINGQYEIFIHPPFNSMLILMYNDTGKVISVQWLD